MPYTLKCCQLIQQSLLAAECRVFGDNSAVEFQGISQIAPHNLSKYVMEKRARDYYCVGGLLTV